MKGSDREGGGQGRAATALPHPHVSVTVQFQPQRGRRGLFSMLPIPKALIRQGHRDMLRISDARMSGTSYGACVLHVAPESFVGGPLALLRTGDIVRLDLPARRLDMLVDEAEIARRRAAWVAPEPRYARGWGYLFQRHVSQANDGCDFDFLTRSFGPAAAEPEIF